MSQNKCVIRQLSYKCYSYHQTYLYLIKTEKIPDCDGSSRRGYVKIGITTNIENRLKALQSGCPYKLRLHSAVVLCTEHLAGVVERHLHHKFRKSRVNGEWFKLTTDLDDYIREDFENLGLKGVEIDWGDNGEKVY